MEEKQLLENGWKKEILCLHMQEYDEKFPAKFRRMSYSLCNDFTARQIDIIRLFVNEVNNRFPNIKLSVNGTGFYMPEDKTETEYEE